MIGMLRYCSLMLCALLWAVSVFAEDELAVAPVQQDTVQEHEKVVSFLLQQTPLMVIRFNRPHLMYDESIKKVAQQALHTQAQARFILIGRIPKTEEAAFTQKSQVFLSQHIAHVKDLLQHAHVTADNIQEYLVLDSPTGFNEIAIFVQ